MKPENKELKPCQNDYCPHHISVELSYSNCSRYRDVPKPDCSKYTDKPRESAWEMFREVYSKMNLFLLLEKLTNADIAHKSLPLPPEPEALKILKQIQGELK